MVGELRPVLAWDTRADVMGETRALERQDVSRCASLHNEGDCESTGGTSSPVRLGTSTSMPVNQAIGNAFALYNAVLRSRPYWLEPLQRALLAPWVDT